MGKTGVHVISKNVNYRRDGFKRLKILEKDQELVMRQREILHLLFPVLIEWHQA